MSEKIGYKLFMIIFALIYGFFLYKGTIVEAQITTTARYDFNPQTTTSVNSYVITPSSNEASLSLYQTLSNHIKPSTTNFILPPVAIKETILPYAAEPITKIDTPYLPNTPYGVPVEGQGYTPIWGQQGYPVYQYPQAAPMTEVRKKNMDVAGFFIAASKDIKFLDKYIDNLALLEENYIISDEDLDTLYGLDLQRVREALITNLLIDGLINDYVPNITSDLYTEYSEYTEYDSYAEYSDDCGTTKSTLDVRVAISEQLKTIYMLNNHNNY
ncbi:MAG: hypothetical protein ACMUJM_11545 [bacterium]